MTRHEHYVLAWRMAAVSGALSAAIVLLLLVDFASRASWDPLNSPDFVALRMRLLEDPQDDAAREELRALDREMREAYFDRRRFTAWGGWLLLGTAGLCLFFAKRAATLCRPLPDPQEVDEEDQEDPDLRELRAATWCVAAVGGSAVLLALVLAVGFRTVLPTDLREWAEVELAEPAAPDEPPRPAEPEPEPGLVIASPDELPDLPAGYPDRDEVQRYWPRFRGPGGRGWSAWSNLPDTWDGETGEGILWKTPIPRPGNSSPIVWGDRLFVTGGDEEAREVYCLDANTGELLWQRAVVTPEGIDGEAPEVMAATGLAAPTAVTDGRRVYAMFATGDLAAFDFDGHLRWQRSWGVPDNAYGHAASLEMYRDRLLIQYDQGTRNDELSRVIALEAETGRTVWQQVREVPNSWSSPIVIHGDPGPQLITTAAPWVIAYAPEDGREIWRVDYLFGDVGPSPTYAEGVVYVANEFPGAAAIRADGSGDVTDTHLLWEADLGVPDTSSPLATDELVFLAATYGILTCYDAREGGEPLWELEFDSNLISSPSLVGDVIYLFGEEGDLWIIEPEREEGRIVAQNSLGERCVTSPAFQDGRMYIRGETHVFCIGNP